MKIIYQLLLITIFMLVSSNIHAKDNGLPVWYDENRDAVADLEIASKIAKDRKILVIAGGDWCGWCHRLDKFIKNNKTVSDLLHKTFVVLKVNFSEENHNQPFFSLYPGIKGYPAFIILDKNKKFLAIQNTSSLETGDSYSKSAMISFINKWK